jgi:hypothetical protein
MKKYLKPFLFITIAALMLVVMSFINLPKKTSPIPIRTGTSNNAQKKNSKGTCKICDSYKSKIADKKNKDRVEELKKELKNHKALSNCKLKK